MRALLLISILTISLSSIGQEQKLIENGQYYFYKTLKPSESKSKFSKESPEVEIMRKHIVQIVSADSKEVKYKYLMFSNPERKELYNGLTGDKTFTMSIENFTFYTRPYLNRWRKWKVGTYSVPIRLRSKKDNFEFESNLSLGANLVKGINLSRFGDLGHIDLSAGIGLTKVNLTTENSNIAAFDPEIEKLSESALTISLGLTLHLAKNVNLGLFYGWDYLDGSEQKKLNWSYNRKPWFGFGINVGFTENGSDNTSEKTRQK